ncbi:MAG: hypothetical protein KGS72_02110 [Cyanobacteria bacterium REEB67]|nr:hypothetical protein [Cyanobacteria bacterium REEB67]
MAVGILSLILILSSGMLIWQFASRGSKSRERSGRIPPNMQVFLSSLDAMAAVRSVLADELIVGCRWRITYDRGEEGRIQARLYGKPVGGEGSVDILMNMLFHRLEPSKTELEWSYVVMSGQPVSADRVIDSTNAALRTALDLKAGKIKAPPETPTKTCFNCHKDIESGFTFCIYCGASVS